MPRARKVKPPPPTPIAHTGEIPRWIFQDANGENFRSFEWEFAQQWEDAYPEIDLVAQHPFIPTRMFRFDFAHLASKTAIEIQGGTNTTYMGHSSVSGRKNDGEKKMLAGTLGWFVCEVPTDEITLERLASIKETIGVRLKAMAAQILNEEMT